MHDRQYTEEFNSQNLINYGDSDYLVNNADELNLLSIFGVNILTHVDHYDNGNNLNFSIEFFDEEGEKIKQTSWFGDNHEYGDEERAIECAIKLAWYLLENPEIRNAERYGKNARPDLSDKMSEFIFNLFDEETKAYYKEETERRNT